MIKLNQEVIKTSLMDEYIETLVGMDIDITLTVRQIIMKNELDENVVRDFFNKNISKAIDLLTPTDVSEEWESEMCKSLVDVMNKYEPSMKMVEVAIQTLKERMNKRELNKNPDYWEEYFCEG